MTGHNWKHNLVLFKELNLDKDFKYGGYPYNVKPNDYHKSDDLFLKDLNDVARSLAPLIKDERRRKKNKLDKLRNVVKTNDKSKNLDLLKKYWDIWKNHKGFLDDYVITLQKKVRQLLSKKKLGLLRRLNEIIMKLFLTNEEKKKDLLRSKLRQWRAIARSMECDENARIIQNFCRTKLKNYL